MTSEPDDAPVPPPAGWGTALEREVNRGELERLGAVRAATYEAAAVKALCRLWAGPGAHAALRKRLAELSRDSPVPTLGFFGDVFGDFPFSLYAAKIRGADATDPADWFSRPTRTAPHRAWVEAQRTHSEEFPGDARPFGVVFPWRDLAKFMVIHDTWQFLGRVGRRISYSAPHPRSGVAVFVVEPLEQLVAQLRGPSGGPRDG